MVRNPLYKRLPRDLRDEFGKYFVIFVLLVFSISLMSGYLVGGESMIKAYDDSFEKYNIENGNFTVNKKLNPAEKKNIEELGIRIYEQFYVTRETADAKQLRIFKDRTEVNKVCLMSGRLPEKTKEIAIDRMFAENNSLSIGDVLRCENDEYIITGLVALSDYSALFENNSDIMFDAVSFSVCILNDEDFSSFSDYTYNYAFKYADEPVDEAREKEVSEQLMKDINAEVRLSGFTPRYLNQAIRFTGIDLSGDQGMMEILLYMIIVIIAFVFAITTSNTIQKEMTVIGTLLASGYSKRELLTHYMIMPELITVFSAIIGNILGYTYMKDLCVALYYNSYSLPTYVTVWSLDALIKTTLIPLTMITAINFAIIFRSLDMPIMNFLRRQSSSSASAKALPLNKHIPFFARYRIRIILQNLGSYGVLLIGIIFANLLLLFGLDLPVLLNNYQREVENNPLASYVTMLKLPDSINSDEHKLETTIELLNFVNETETENETAEKFTAYALQSAADPEIGYKGEDILVYGIIDDSRYIDIDTSDHRIYVSRSYSDKFELEKGDRITLKEKYSDKYYSFEIDGVYDYLGALCIFMPFDDLNEVFDLGRGTYAGYFSDSKITDIDSRYIGTIIDQNSLTRLSRQLNVSFGSMMDMVVVFAVVIYVVLIYILSKAIIDKNSQSISMNKIMGYNDLEIGRLYIVTTSIVFVLMLLGSLPLECYGLKIIFRIMLIQKMNGWLPLVIESKVIIKVILLALSSYVFIGLFELRRIANVKMDQALKNVE